MLKVTDIELHYGKRQILNGLSFDAGQGDCIGILGVNGCGKSTLLKILSGALAPGAGSVAFYGEDAVKKHHLFVRYTGYVPQDNPLMEDLTVLDNLKLWCSNKSSNLKAELDRGVLHMLKLHTVAKCKVRTLSGGMKKRLSIGCALANRPELLLLDEPTAALDLPCKEDIRDSLRLYIKNGGSVIITTHEEADLMLCNRLLVLKQGGLHEISSDTRGAALLEQLGESETPM